jgi:HEAT repeat protein
MPLFMGFFSHSDVHVLKDKRDVYGLQKLLEHEKDRPTRIAAAEALGAIGDDRAVSSLIAVLGHDSEDVRMFAAIALGKIGNERAVLPLINSLRDDHHMVRESAALALGALEDIRAIDPLHHALDDEYEEVRKAAACALDLIEDEDPTCLAYSKVGNCR